MFEQLINGRPATYANHVDSYLVIGWVPFCQCHFSLPTQRPTAPRTTSTPWRRAHSFSLERYPDFYYKKVRESHILTRSFWCSVEPKSGLISSFQRRASVDAPSIVHTEDGSLFLSSDRRLSSNLPYNLSSGCVFQAASLTPTRAHCHPRSSRVFAHGLSIIFLG